MLVAWWYAGLYKNQKDGSQPHVLVAFREISAGTVSEKVIHRRIPLVALGQVRIGSIWKDDRCIGDVCFPYFKCNVDFTRDSWRFTSPYDARDKHQPPPFPPNTHRLRYENDRSWLTEFDLPTGGKLLIPCIELFARCYGRSGEIKRVLATYPWQGQSNTDQNRLYAPSDTPEEPGKWSVRLRRRLVDGDAVFLAHAKYDAYTERAAKSIYAQIEATHDPNFIIPAFIKVPPWFQGKAELKVQGIPFDDGRSFLALRVIGMSDPVGVPILRSRENSGEAETSAPEGSPEAWSGAPQRMLLKTPEAINLTGDFAPDNEFGAIEVQDPDFEILGIQRDVIKVKAKQAITTSGSKRFADVPPSFSGGETSGNGKGVGHASIHAKPIFESHGVLYDMWNAMLSLAQSQPDLIRAVSWFTFTHGFNNAAIPELISLEPFEADANVSSEIRRFPFMDPATQSLRGVLVARITVSEGYAYIVEIMRRPRKTMSDDGQSIEAEESFQGMIFCLRNENELSSWLRELFSRIRFEKGVFKRLTNICPGVADSFSHRLSGKISDGTLPYESVVLNALSKLKGPTKGASSE